MVSRLRIGLGNSNLPLALFPPNVRNLGNKHYTQFDSLLRAIGIVANSGGKTEITA